MHYHYHYHYHYRTAATTAMPRGRGSPCECEDDNQQSEDWQIDDELPIDDEEINEWFEILTRRVMNGLKSEEKNIILLFSLILPNGLSQNTPIIPSNIKTPPYFSMSVSGWPLSS